MRLTGLATGMDMDKMIQEMLKPYKMRLDKTGQDKQIIEWKQEIYRDVIKDVNDIRTKYFDVLKGENYLLSSNSYYGVKVDTEDKLANIVANSTAKEGKYTLEVTSIAKAAKISSKSKIGKTESEIEGMTLSQLGVRKDSKLNIRCSGSENPIEINIDNPDMTIKEFQEKINLETNGKVKLEISNGSIKLTDAMSFEDETGIIDKINLSIKPSLGTRLSDLGITPDSEFSIDYTGAKKPVKIDVDEHMTIDQLIYEVSEKTGGEVKLSFNELSGKISFETKSIGSDVELKLENVNGNILDKLKITTTANNGEDATFTIHEPDGTIEKNVIKNTNKFTINGVTYDLKEKSSEKMEFNIVKDTDKGFNLIKGFVEDYNKLVKKTNDLTSEKKNYKFSPLTEEQKKDMKEDEIKKWEEKAKEGIIKGDSYLQNMMSALRSSFFEKVEDSQISFQGIGINTSKEYKEGGKLYIDEEKLKKALAEDPEKVINLFTKTSTTHPMYDRDLTSEEKKVRNKEQGIFERLNDILQDYTTTSPNSNGYRGILLEKAGLKGTTTEFNNLLSKSIKDKDKIILDQTRKLEERESRLYMQFAQLEKAMNSLNSQQSWFMQQMGMGQ